MNDRLPATGARCIGVVMILYGVALAWPAWQLVALGGSPGFFLSALGTFVAGGMFCVRKRAALWVYMLVMLGTIVWAITQAGVSPVLLLPRIWPALLLGLFTIPLFFARKAAA